jgi:predicted amidohydrolase
MPFFNGATFQLVVFINFRTEVVRMRNYNSIDMMRSLLFALFGGIILMGFTGKKDHTENPGYPGSDPKPFTLAIVQMEVRGGDQRWNMNHAAALIKQAASNGADVVMLPECLDLGWTHPSSLEMAEPIPDGFPCQELMKSARENNIYVCAGITEKTGSGNYNTAVLIDRNGSLLIIHRKLNELDIGHPYYGQGDRLNVAATEFGTIGIIICADGTAKDHVLTRSLGYMGADVILSPSAWAVEADYDNDRNPYGDTWRDAYIPVAKEFSMYIFSASNVGWITGGPWKDWKCIGNSLGFDPTGAEILKGPYGVDAETILYIDVHPAERPARGTDWWKFWSHQESGNE